MFKVLKLRTIIFAVAILLITILTSVGMVLVVGKEVTPRARYTIVVDAGHGGRDNGCSGESGIKESDVNLAIAKILKDYLESLDINVVMTRMDGNGLYEANAENYKQSDMAERLSIINNASPDLVISIHQNSFNDSSQRGAQAFFQEFDDVSKVFADGVQSQLIAAQLPYARSESNDGDYYILKESKFPSVLIECGYLYNREEEVMLGDSEYQNKIAYAIMCGVVKYFDLCG